MNLRRAHGKCVRYLSAKHARGSRFADDRCDLAADEATSVTLSVTCIAAGKQMNRSLRILVVAFAFFPFGYAAGATGDRAGHVPTHADLLTQLEKTDVVREGPVQSTHVLYVFFDANCLYCHLTWKALQPYETAGLQVRWVPVAYQQPSSVGRAAAIMQAPDRAAAMRMNELRYDASKYDGGIEPATTVSAAMVAQLQANTRLMQTIAPGTPVLVWKDGAGKVRVKVGVPRLSALPEITGLPPQPNDDPELAQFR
jgi:thiol:disulfide interchange protein DsbG